MTTVREVMNTELAHIKIDKKFYKDFVELEQAFVHKKPEHIEFFGGTLTGVQKVRFTDHEFNLFFGDLLMIDEDILETKLHNLPTINKDFKVSSNVFNIACVWLIHSTYNSKFLNDKEKEELMVRIALYLYYHFLTSILFNFFKYPANPDTAAATYAQLSNRFILKSEGSWMAALRYRAAWLTKMDGIWRDVIEKMDDDLRVVGMLNDASGSIKSMVINIYSVFINVHNEGKKIHSSSSFIEIDGEIKLRDKTKGLAVYVNYVKSTVIRFDDFYKEELFEVVISVMHTASDHILRDFMKYFCDNYLHFKDRKADKVVENIMEHAFEYLANNTNILRKKEDIGTIVKKMRGTYTSSIASNERLISVKEEVDQLIRQGCHIKDNSMVASVRTAFCLYMILRAFTMKYYQNA